MKRFLVCLLTIALMISGLSACGGKNSGNGAGGSGRPEKIVIGTQSFVHDQQLAIAKGYFQEAFGDEITVEIVDFSAGRDAVQAMISGDVNFIYAGCVPVVSGIASGMNGEVIWIHNVLNVSDAVAAREGSGIESLEDLEGKTVGAVFVAPIHYAFERALEKRGVDINNVVMLDMQPQDIYAAWARGDIDAAVVWDPVLSELEGGKIIYSAGDAAADGFPIFDLGAVDKGFAEKYPELVVKYVQALEKAQQLKKSDLSDAIATLANALELSKEDAETQANGSIWLTAEEQLAEPYFGGQMAESLYSMSLYLYEGGNLAEEPNADLFRAAANGSYIEQALGK